MAEKNETYYPKSIREEELKNKVAKEWFGAFDCTRIIGNVDFCVSAASEGLALGYEGESLLWAEAKAGAKRDIVASFVQLILTIGGKRQNQRNHDCAHQRPCSNSDKYWKKHYCNH